MYNVNYSCSNCGHEFSKEFPKGKKANCLVECPNCECNTGERARLMSDKVQDRIWPYQYPWPEPLRPYTPPPTEWEYWPKYDVKTSSAQWHGQELFPVYGGT